MQRHVICRSEELAAGEHRVVTIKERSIGVFNVEGSHFAVLSRCPHRGAPLCVGQPRGTMIASAVHEYEYGMEGQIIRCPWHGYEFDVKTGRSVAAPDRYRVRTYKVEVEDGDVVLYA